MAGWLDMPRSKPTHAALHGMLGIPVSERIPERVLNAILRTPVGQPVQIGFRGSVMVTTALKYRANFAKNAGQAQSGGF